MKFFCPILFLLPIANAFVVQAPKTATTKLEARALPYDMARNTFDWASQDIVKDEHDDFGYGNRRSGYRGGYGRGRYGGRGGYGYARGGYRGGYARRGGYGRRYGGGYARGGPSRRLGNRLSTFDRMEGNSRLTSNEKYGSILSAEDRKYLTTAERNRVSGPRWGRNGNYGYYRGTEYPVLVEGKSLKTWSFRSPYVERVQVNLETDGRPLETELELWQGPNNCPTKLRVYNEDGCLRPFNAVIETPRGPNTIAIRNTANMEFPLSALVLSDTHRGSPLEDFEHSRCYPQTIQGGALKTYAFDPSVESVEVMLRTDGRPLNARVELLQGPNNNKQVIEIYTEDGLDRPFFAVVETPGSGNVIRIVNTSTVEFPMQAWVEEHSVGNWDDREVVIGGDERPERAGMEDRQYESSYASRW